MFFDAQRILAVREMILADDEAGRRVALAKIEPMQRQDFVELFKIMAACRSRSACSTRRCTSSCRMASRDRRGGALRSASISQGQAAPDGALGIQPMLGIAAAASASHTLRSMRCRPAHLRGDGPGQGRDRRDGDAEIRSRWWHQEGNRHPEGRDRPVATRSAPVKPPIAYQVGTMIELPVRRSGPGRSPRPPSFQLRTTT